jgi:hypothetical protein
VNLLPYSQDFTDASWSKVDTTVSLVSGDIFEITESGSGDQTPYIIDNVTISSGVAHSIAVDVKDVDRGYAFLQWTDATNRFAINVDLSNGSVTDTDTVGTPGVLGYGVIPRGDGWYRVWISAISATTNGYLVVGLSDSALPSWNASAVPQYTISGKKIQARYAQLEEGPTPSSYIPTSGATATRSADTLTAASANLPWPSPVVIGEELVTNGDFSDGITGWTVPEADATLSVSGEVATLIQGSVDNFCRAYQAITCEIGKCYQVSVEVTAVSNTISPRIHTSPAGTPSAPTWLGDSVSSPQVVSGTFVASATTMYFIMMLPSADGASASFDNISVREINPLAVSIQMDGTMTYADEDLAFGNIRFVNWYRASNSDITIDLKTNTGSGTLLVTQDARGDGGAFDTVEGNGSEYSPGINVPFNIASRHGSTFINGAVDGTALTVNPTPTALPDLSATNMQIGYDYMGNIGKLRIWSDDLGDAGIATATIADNALVVGGDFFLTSDGEYFIVQEA